MGSLRRRPSGRSEMADGTMCLGGLANIFVMVMKGQDKGEEKDRRRREE